MLSKAVGRNSWSSSMTRFLAALVAKVDAFFGWGRLFDRWNRFLLRHLPVVAVLAIPANAWAFYMWLHHAALAILLSLAFVTIVLGFHWSKSRGGSPPDQPQSG